MHVEFVSQMPSVRDAYQGQTEAIRKGAPKAQDMTCNRTRYKNRVD
jgi:hypothetical protein